MHSPPTHLLDESPKTSASHPGRDKPSSALKSLLELREDTLRKSASGVGPPASGQPWILEANDMSVLLDTVKEITSHKSLFKNIHTEKVEWFLEV